MKTKLLLIATFMVALVLLAGCGGGGGDVAVVSAANVTFTNVSVNPLKTSVIPGERDVEVAAFRMVWKDQNRSPIGQLVFGNKSADSLWTTFKDFRIVDSDGNDVNREARYNIRRDDERHEVVVDFYQSAWFPNDFGVVPKTYSLLASMDPTVAVGVTFAFELSAVQMHDAGKTVASEVKGGQFKVMSVVGMGLPIVTTASPSSFAVANDLGGKMAQIGSFEASCPAESAYACTLMAVKYFASGVSEPTLNVDGAFIGSSRGNCPDDCNVFNAFVGYSIPPGQSKTFALFAVPYEPTVWISVADMVWAIGGQQTKVSPVVPTDSASCGLMIRNGKNCMG